MFYIKAIKAMTVVSFSFMDFLAYHETITLAPFNSQP